ncbi:MAG: hypothetical protein KC467_15990 [Marinomonas atlantica]|nr:hypothetical protein [Marinomonas atlantica]
MNFINKHRNKLSQVSESVSAEVEEAVKAQPELSLIQKRLKARQAAKTNTNEQVQTEVKPATTVKDLEYYQAIASAYLDKMADLEDIEARKPIKAEGVIKLQDFVSDYVSKGANYPNSVAVTLLIWLMDLDDMATATPLALHLIKQGIHRTPANFHSDLPSFVCKAFYDWASARHKKNQAAGPYLHNIVHVMADDGWDVSDKDSGMMFAMLGKHYELAGQDNEAVEMYRLALRENDGAGVKKRLSDLEKKLGLDS